jgi:hypothetical protein
MAQVVVQGPEFELQYHQKKKKKLLEPDMVGMHL